MYPDVANYACFIRNKKKLPLLTEIADESGYFPMFYGVPRVSVPSDLAFAGNVTKRFTIQPPPGSLIVGLSGYSSQASGFTYTIIDQGSKLPTGSQIHSGTLGSWNNSSYNVSTYRRQSGWYFFQMPIVVVAPGSISIEITNLSNGSNNIQMCLLVHVPQNQKNTGMLGVS